ncbi:hypothetical protein N0V93_001150 [Gnomoniopsis smithogilvyi]|uniref:Uncharacterized protein n=1 Tax=Gnomoniopsis smithogilvyi TaxID=1191159 RepID=A0A9W8Z372_9PEZI|nr:hypothetical protein N0V93_001150 [Gnomoniopsis smithogilvyi]
MASQTTTDITTPISPARFAAALKDLSIASLHLKVLEIRNALLHLAHSNAQLQPFADGTETSLNLAPGEPDPDCVEAIRENEIVIERMRERIELVKAEVVARGVSWREFEEVDEVEDDEPGAGVGGSQVTGEEAGSRPLTNGLHGTRNDDEEEAEANNGTANTTTRGNPWTDGTFQVGTIRNGELHMDTEPPQRNGTRANGDSAVSTTTTTTTSTQPGAASSGGRLTDEELRRLLEVRLAEDANDDEDGGLHL